MADRIAKRPEIELFGDNEEALKNVQKIDDTIKDFDTGAGLFLKGAASSLGTKKSIIGKARENLFEFPVFMSDTVNLEFATAVNTLLEQMYSSYLQMAISANPTVDSELLKRQGIPLSKFKTNTTKYVETVDFDFQKDACHAVYNNGDTIIEYSMISITDAEANILLEASNFEPLSEFDHYFTEANDDGNGGKGGRGRNNNGGLVRGKDGHLYSRNGLRIDDDDSQEAMRQHQDAMDIIRMQDADTRKKDADTRAYDADTRRKESEARIARDDAESELRKTAQQMRDNAAKADREKITRAEEEINKEIRIDKLTREIDFLKYDMDSATGEEKEKLQAQIKTKREQISSIKLTTNPEVRGTIQYRRLLDEFEDFQRKSDDAKYKRHKELREQSKEEREIANERRNREKHAFDTKIKAPQMLDEGKINKINTMKPLMMIVNLSVTDKYGGISRPIEFVVGVKTFCRLVDSQTLPEVVEYPMKEMNKISRKAKWRAGELKFFKDIVFHIKEKKQTAIDKNDPKRKWYRRLYELSHMKGDAFAAKKITGHRGEEGLIPNASLVISKADVDFIEDRTKVDLLNGKVASKFCNELFMMALVVVDTDAQSIKVLLPDISNEYEVQSIAAVNKQISLLNTASEKTNEVFKMLRA